MPELNHSGCCSPSRLLEPKKNKKLSSAMLTGDRDGTLLLQKRPWTGCLQNCEEHFEVELIQRRNSKDATGDSQIGCTNHGLSAGDGNGHIDARISDTTEGVESKSVCTKVYYRKNKRHRSTEYFQGQPTNRNLDASHSETASCTGEEEIVLAGEIASHNLTSGREIDSEKSWFFSSLKENGLLHGERNGTIMSQTLMSTRCSPISEKLADNKLVETRNDVQPLADSQNGCTNKTSADEDSNDCKCAKISGTAEDMGKKHVCTRVYCRKSYKKPHDSPATGHVQSQCSNGDDYASNSGRSSFTSKEGTNVIDKTRTCNLTSAREIDLEKLCHVSISTENGSVSGNNDCMTLSPRSRSKYLQICEKLSNTNIGNDKQPVADSQIESTSNQLTVEDSNNCECAEVCRTAEEVRDKRECKKVYYRKKFKRPYSSSATRYFQGQSANRDQNASTSEKSFYTTHGNIAGADEIVSHDFTPGRDTICEKLWCISILKENGLLGHFPQSCRVMEHQTVVGDGTVDHKCKICDRLEDSETLICDMCEESFHISCLNPKKLTSNYADNWYCSTCTIKKHKDLPCNPQKESKYAYLLRQMLDENVQHKSCVRIGCDYQAEIPEYAGQPSESSESQSIGFEVSLEEKILEKVLVDDNLKNNIWEKGWKPANALPPGAQENWLQCKAIIHKKGDICPDGLKTRREIACGKWRRAPLSEVQTEKWDCSCAVLWDPHHADCFVPQEIQTAEIQKRNKQGQQRNEVYLLSQQLEG